MENTNDKVYSEVYSLLQLLGDEYIYKLPIKLVDFIKRKKDDSYNPTYSLTKDITSQGISKLALSMITLFNIKYWCTSAEKEIILNKLLDNEKKS